MKKIIVTFALGALVFLILPGCYKVATVTIDSSPAITKSVSFSKDMAPVFSKSCALAGCHGNGGHTPDLSAGNAYNALVKGNYINTATPEKSLLYLWLTGKEAEAMPLGTSNNPSNINALTLAWIKQGAVNN
jgi:hypothetical protein